MEVVILHLELNLPQAYPHCEGWLESLLNNDTSNIISDKWLEEEVKS